MNTVQTPIHIPDIIDQLRQAESMWPPSDPPPGGGTGSSDRPDEPCDDDYPAPPSDPPPGGSTGDGE